MKVLIVDDDRVLADIVAYTFRRDGFDVAQAYDGPPALDVWSQGGVDLLVLDVNLPSMDGFTVLRQIRESSDIPVIMLTVRGDDDDVVQGLELGADDYIPKPFSPRQLVARAHAVLRRVAQPSAPAPRQIKDLTLAPNKREVQIGEGEALPLSDLEGRFLDLLIQNTGQVVPVETIYEYVWGTNGGDQDILRQLVRRLRNKIERHKASPVYIKNIPGLGYGLMLVDEKQNP